MSLTNMMNYSFMPSLEYMALVKIIGKLCHQNEFGNLRAMSTPCIETLKNTMVVNIYRLLLPELLTKKLVRLVDLLSHEILNWWTYHVNYFPEEFVCESSNKLCWTQQGTVDRKRTAEVLVKDENTDISIRYKLACFYCLHNDIPLLWDKMPKHLRKTFCCKKYLKHVKKEGENCFEIIWAHDLEGKLNKLIRRSCKLFDWQVSPYRYGFNVAINTANKVAAEYCFQRLTPEEQNESLALFIREMNDVDCNFWSCEEYIMPRGYYSDIPRGYFSDTLCFLLSLMTEEQQTEVFKKHSYRVLLCFLDWPLQKLFMRLANCVWSFLSVKEYHLLCEPLLHVYIGGIRNSDSKKFFREFWQQSPNFHKKHVMNDPMLACDLLLNLFRIGRENDVRLILKEANSQEKEDIIYSDYGVNICEMLSVGRNASSGLLDFFIDECISSKSTGDKLKKRFK